MVNIRPAKTVFEIVDEGAFDVSEVNSVEICSLDLKIRVVKVFDVFELIVPYFGHKVVVDLINLLRGH